MTYFNNIHTLEDLKTQYKILAMKHHPDRGGDEETMKVINAEYDTLFARIKNFHRAADGNIYEHSNTESADVFKNIISELLRTGVNIEIIGRFIWVSGDTKPAKELLKKLGFKWHSKKQMWYKAPDGYRRKGKKEYSISEIRSMYGTTGNINNPNAVAV